MAAKLGAEEIISKIINLALEKQEITDISVSNMHCTITIQLHTAKIS